jgi:hypothetical protein
MQDQAARLADVVSIFKTGAGVATPGHERAASPQRAVIVAAKAPAAAAKAKRPAQTQEWETF